MKLHTGTNTLEKRLLATIRTDKGPKEEYDLIAYTKLGTQYVNFSKSYLVYKMKKGETMLIRYGVQPVGDMAYDLLLPFLFSLGTNATMLLDSRPREHHGSYNVTFKFDLAGFTDACEKLQTVCRQ